MLLAGRSTCETTGTKCLMSLNYSPHVDFWMIFKNSEIDILIRPGASIGIFTVIPYITASK